MHRASLAASRPCCSCLTLIASASLLLFFAWSWYLASRWSSRALEQPQQQRAAHWQQRLGYRSALTARAASSSSPSLAFSEVAAAAAMATATLVAVAPPVSSLGDETRPTSLAPASTSSTPFSPPIEQGSPAPLVLPSPAASLLPSSIASLLPSPASVSVVPAAALAACPAAAAAGARTPLRALLFTMDSITDYVAGAARGGPAGEILIRVSLERALRALGVVVDVAESDAAFSALSAAPGATDAFALIILDPWTFVGANWAPRPFLPGREASTFLLSFFGMAAAGHGLELDVARNILSPFPAPGAPNAFLGYALAPRWRGTIVAGPPDPPPAPSAAEGAGSALPPNATGAAAANIAGGDKEGIVGESDGGLPPPSTTIAAPHGGSRNGGGDESRRRRETSREAELPAAALAAAAPLDALQRSSRLLTDAEEAALGLPPLPDKARRGVVWGKKPSYFDGKWDALARLAADADVQLHLTLDAASFPAELLLQKLRRPVRGSGGGSASSAAASPHEAARPLTSLSASASAANALASPAPAPALLEEEVPAFVLHGHLDPEEWQALLGSARFLLGLGDPLAGPSAVDALAAGAVFLCPEYASPKETYFHSQHPFLEAVVGPPYTCSYAWERPESLLACARAALDAPPLPPFIPRALTEAAYAKRVCDIFSPALAAHASLQPALLEEPSAAKAALQPEETLPLAALTVREAPLLSGPPTLSPLAAPEPAPLLGPPTFFAPAAIERLASAVAEAEIGWESVQRSVAEKAGGAQGA